ncbi:MAG: hypothetical protein IJW49_08145 [Clostridia bacterium]|nr:hypothetical protein [Clostridia bacterium]
MLHMMFAWPICAWRVVKSFGNSYETADQSWTTYHVSSSSSGSVDVRKENHYSAGGTSYFTLENIFLFFTFPIWVLPHFVYLVMLKPKMDLERLSSEVPPQMIDAFVFAYKNTKPVRFPSASEKKYKSEEDTYKKESEKIEYKYSLLGIEEARRQLEKLPLPFVQVELEGKNYLLVLMIKEKENTFYYLLSRNNSQIIGTIFKNEYRVASNRDWKKEWTEEIDQWSALGKNVQKIVSNLDFYASKIK